MQGASGQTSRHFGIEYGSVSILGLDCSERKAIIFIMLQDDDDGDRKQWATS